MSDRIIMINSVLLASGKSSRFGINKLMTLSEKCNEPMIIKSLKTLLNGTTGNVVVTLRPEQIMEKMAIAFFLNKKYSQRVHIFNVNKKNRQDSSLPALLETLIKEVKNISNLKFSCSNGILVCLADMPYIKKETIKKIFEKGCLLGDKQALAPVVNGHEGHPVWIGKKLFSKIIKSKAGLEGIKIKKIIKNEGVWNIIDVQDIGITRDIDRKEDVLMPVESWFKPQGVKILVIGAGDLASGVVYRLFKSGFDVVASEIDPPLTVRLDASFSKAVLKNETQLQGVTAKKCTSLPDKIDYLNKYVPVLVQKDVSNMGFIPNVIIDGRMSKKYSKRILESPLVIGLGPGFIAGDNCDYVIETMRGITLGRVIDKGAPLDDTGEPAPVQGHSKTRLLKAPETGIFMGSSKIGDIVSKGDILGTIHSDSDSQECQKHTSCTVIAQIDGLLRGLIADKSSVKKGMKIGDIDPRGAAIDHACISDKALSIGGAVLEALLYHFCNPEKS